jgi:hypothetical protein
MNISRFSKFKLLSQAGLSVTAGVAIIGVCVTPLMASPSEPPPPPGNSVPSAKLPTSDPTPEEFRASLGVPLEDAGGNFTDVEVTSRSVNGTALADGYAVNPPVWDHETKTIKIHVVRATPTAEQQAQYRKIAASAGFNLTVDKVERSEAESEALQSRIDSDRAVLAEKGIDLGTTGILGGGDRVEVNVYEGTAAKAEYLMKTYGTVGLQINIGSVPRPSDAATRSTDSAPWYLGDRIWMPELGQGCTSGFHVTKPGHGAYMLTSGHCLRGTGIVVDYWFDISKYFGYASQVDYVDSAPADSALITGSYSPFVWNTETTILAQRTVSGSDIVGQDTCFNGSYTKQVCRSYVYATNVTVPTAIGVTTGNVEVHATPGVTICQQGDSGGPVYDASPGNGIRARGIIKAYNFNDASIGYFMPWYRLAPRLGYITLNTP